MPYIRKRVYQDLKTYKMDEHSENDFCNENESIILNKTESVKSDDDIALGPLHTSIEESGKALNSSG